MKKITSAEWHTQVKIFAKIPRQVNLHKEKSDIIEIMLNQLDQSV